VRSNFILNKGGSYLSEKKKKKEKKRTPCALQSNGMLFDQLFFLSI